MGQDDLDLGYVPQKQVIYNKLLPYKEYIRTEILEQFCDIKENLAKAVVLRDIRPGCIHWVAKLSRFVKLYGMCFSKEDHILLVKLMYELSVTLNQEFWVMAKFAQMLTILLKKKELLAPDELVLEWRPLYELYNSLFYNSYNTIGMLMLPSRTRRAASRLLSRKKGETSNAEGVVESMIRVCRPYFSPGSTSEILEEVRPMMCPFDMTMQRAMVYLELFLPTSLNPEQAECGWKLWKDELLGIWNACHNSNFWFWENSLFWLFSRLAWHNIGYVEWEEHLPMIFTKVLRSFRLPVSYKKALVGKGDGLSQFASAMFIVANLVTIVDNGPFQASSAIA